MEYKKYRNLGIICQVSNLLTFFIPCTHCNKPHMNFQCYLKSPGEFIITNKNKLKAMEKR